MASSNQQSQKVKEHLARSLGKFTLSSGSSIGFMNSEERKRQIMEHLRLTQG